MRLLPLSDFLFAALAALPFLPRGKGAAILILGGMALLAFSLCWSMLVLRTARSRSRAPVRGRRAPQPRIARASGPLLGIRVPWLGTLMATAVRSGLGDPKIIGLEPDRQLLRLDDCRTCRGRRGSPGCERERAALERVLRTLSPKAEVTEIACNSGHEGACTFELRTGAHPR